MHQNENISSRGSFHGSRGLLIRMSIVSLTSPSANVLKRFANVFNPILMAHCRDSKLNFFNRQLFCFPKCYHTWFPKFIYKKLGNLKSVTHDYRVLLKKIRAGRMQIEESK